MEAIIQVFFATCVVLKIGQYHSDIPQFQLGIFSQETRFNRPIAGERKYLIYYTQLFIVE